MFVCSGRILTGETVKTRANHDAGVEQRNVCSELAVVQLVVTSDSKQHQRERKSIFSFYINIKYRKM